MSDSEAEDDLDPDQPASARQLLAANQQLLIRSLLDQESAESAEEGRAQLNALVEAISEGIAIVDASGAVILMNRAACAILGVAEWSLLSGADADGLDLRDASGVSLARDLRPFTRALRMDHFVDQAVTIVRADAQTRRLLVSGTSTMERGRIALAIVILRDVTEVRELERQQDEYLALVSHDIRAPLAAILLLADSLKRIAETDNLPATVADRAGRIERNAAKISQMVTDLLEATSTADSLSSVRQTPFDLAALVRGSVDLLADPQRGRVRLFDTFEGPCFVVGEPVRIERALGNLVSNALKYSEGAIQVCLERRGAFAAVVVIDQGVGIPSEDLARVFERYFRSRSGLQATESFGLGLYITRLIAEAHGGYAEVKSTIGEGCTFSLVLPLQVAPPAGVSLLVIPYLRGTVATLATELLALERRVPAPTRPFRSG